MSEWLYRHIIIVAAADQAMADYVAAQVDPDDGSDTFRVPLSEDGLEPVTHYACNTLSNDVMAAVMYDSQGTLSTVRWWRLRSNTERLIDTNTEFGVAEEKWSWQDALEVTGLKTVEFEGEI